MHVVYVILATLWCVGFILWLGLIVYAVINTWRKNRPYNKK